MVGPPGTDAVTAGPTLAQGRYEAMYLQVKLHDGESESFQIKNSG